MEETNKRETALKKKKFVLNKKVSVIIPVYNTANYLSECLDSLLKQNYKNLEIICVDDGSTDASATILQYYSNLDSRIKCYRQANKGQSVARNYGLRMATGDYVCFIDSDDLILDNAIFQCVETFFLHPEIEAVVFNMEMFFPNGQHFPCFTGHLFSNDSPILSSKNTEISVNFTNAATCMLKRKFILENGIQFPEGRIYEDWVFMLRVMTSQEFLFFWLDSPLYWYRRDFTQSTTSNITSKCLDLFWAYKESDKLLRALPERRKQIYVNDHKIVNESIGFLLSRVFLTTDSDLIYQYLKNIAYVFQNFPKAYFFQLCNELNIERHYAAKYIFEFYNPKMGMDDTMIFYERLKKNIHKMQIKNEMKRRETALKSRFKAFIKQMIRKIFPAYRVSSSIREEVEGMMFTVYDMQRMLQSVDKRLSNIEGDRKS